MKNDSVPVRTKNTLNVEVLYGRELRGDMVVLEVLRHLGEFALPAEAEEGLRLVEVKDAVAVDAEGGRALLVDLTRAGHGGLAEGCGGWGRGRGCLNIWYIPVNVYEL